LTLVAVDQNETTGTSGSELGPAGVAAGVAAADGVEEGAVESMPAAAAPDADPAAAAPEPCAPRAVVTTNPDAAMATTAAAATTSTAAPIAPLRRDGRPMEGILMGRRVRRRRPRRAAGGQTAPAARGYPRIGSLCIG
jgi:hypothetical protein